MARMVEKKWNKNKKQCFFFIKRNFRREIGLPLYLKFLYGKEKPWERAQVT